MKILICEDEKTLAKVLQEKFEKEKYLVTVILSGEEIMPSLKKSKPDVILLDIIMPKVNGLEVLALIKKDDDLQSIPVIILSNLDEDQKIRQALALGAVDYVVKSQHPINEVVEKVHEFLLKAK